MAGLILFMYSGNLTKYISFYYSTFLKKTWNLLPGFQTTFQPNRKRYGSLYNQNGSTNFNSVFIIHLKCFANLIIVDYEA